MKVITIGRDVENDVVIDDTHASRHHLQIILHDDGHYTLSDFGSTNGTFVNGRQISGEIPINPNDIVRIGNTIIPWRQYFEDPDDVEVQSPNDNTDSVVTQSVNAGKKKRSGFVTFCLVFMAAYILFILVLLLGYSEQAYFGPIFHLLGIISAAMIIYGFLLKSKLESSPFDLVEPNGERPGSLVSVFGIGQNLLGAIKFRQTADGSHVSYTFFRIFYPLFPTGCYRVKLHSSGFNSTEWLIYGSEKSDPKEVLCIYLLLYGFIIWIFATIFVMMSFSW